MATTKENSGSSKEAGSRHGDLGAVGTYPDRPLEKKHDSSPQANMVCVFNKNDMAGRRTRFCTLSLMFTGLEQRKS